MTVSESTEFSVSSSKHDPYSFISSPASPAEAPAINPNGKNFMLNNTTKNARDWCIFLIVKLYVIYATLFFFLIHLTMYISKLS